MNVEQFNLIMKKFNDIKTLLESFENREEAIEFLERETNLPYEECAKAYDFTIKANFNMMIKKEETKKHTRGNKMVENIKKVELHLHLDGAVPIEYISNISKESIDSLKSKMIAPDKCLDLGDYLTRFNTPGEYMQTKENLSNIAELVVNYLETQNVIYAEIRFAPMFHTNEGLSYDEVVESVLAGLKRNERVKTNLILCMMRGLPKENNLKTIEVAEKYLGKGVCSLDIAGDEGKYPLNEFINLFELANEKKIPFTIHAGETGSFENIDLAISLGAKRIGHGISSIKSEKTLKSIIDNNVLLEICPTSNLQTNNVDIYENHPIKCLYDNNIKVCINTDNTTVSNITLNEEYQKLADTFKFTKEDFTKMNIEAIKHAFITGEEKEQLLNELLKERI